MNTVLRHGVLCLLVFGAVFSHGRASAGQPGGPPPAVTVERVETISKSEPKTYIGAIKASETVGVVARVSGTLWKVHFEEGAMVREGQLLFEIEDTDYQASVQAAEALVQQAEADLELAKKEHERSTGLLQSRAISTQSFDITKATELLKQARLAEARASLVLAEENLRRCRIHAPLSGRIGEKKYSEGNYVTPSSGVLATIVDSTPVKVQFSVSEADYFRYFTNHDEWRGAEVDLIRANGDMYKGAIKTDFVDNTVDRRTDTIMISLLCDNQGGQLLPGGYVQVRLAEDFGQQLPAVSVSAVMTDGVGHYVYVVDDGGTVEKRAVTTGAVVSRRQVVREGLEPGETVLVGGMNKVRPGIRVNPVFTDRDAQAAREKRVETAQSL